MTRALARVIFAAAVALTVLFSTVPCVEAGASALRLQAPVEDAGTWFDAVMAWFEGFFSTGAPETEAPIDFAFGAAAPTGPCIDPLGGGTGGESACAIK